MMKRLVLFLWLVGMVLPAVAKDVRKGTTYYVDSRSGADHHSGVRPGEAWKTLDRVNRECFKPGDRILFRSGAVFDGTLELQGNGEEGAPIVVDRYGRGEKPLIQGGGRKRHALLVENVEYWEINHLAVTNLGEKPEPRRCGVFIHAKDRGEVRHIRLNGLKVYDVNGSCVKSLGGGNGIYWENGGDRVKTRFVDLRIENCHVFRCQRNGITGNGNSRRSHWFPSLGVVIRGNLIEQVPGDAIVPIACDGALVEHNVVRDCPDMLGMEDAAAGIWPWSCDHTTIQYNEVSGHYAKWDAQGFDSDYNCRNTLIQYNYSHDNAGGFLLVCNQGNTLGQDYNIGTESTVVRYNLSENDGLRPYPTRPGWFSPTIHISGPAKDTKIYGNVVLVYRKPSEEIDRTILKMDNWGGPWPEKVMFTDNVFCVVDDEREYRFDLGKAEAVEFSGNRFYGNFSNRPDGGEKVSDKLDFIGEFPRVLRKKIKKAMRQSQNYWENRQ